MLFMVQIHGETYVCIPSNEHTNCPQYTSSTGSESHNTNYNVHNHGICRQKQRQIIIYINSKGPTTSAIFVALLKVTKTFKSNFCCFVASVNLRRFQCNRGSRWLVSENICSVEGNSAGIFVSKVSPGVFVIKVI